MHIPSFSSTLTPKSDRYPQRTIFDSLHHEGLDFGVYYKNIPSVLTLRNMRRKEYISRFHWFDTFKDHASEGKLKNLSLIEPRYFDLVGKVADDDHPSHDVSNGQRLVKEVYEALRSSPQWNESLLIVTYDEHGGFYDHVQTPCVGVPSPDGIKGPEPSFFEFDRLGVRIPTIMVSPWIKKGIGNVICISYRFMFQGFDADREYLGHCAMYFLLTFCLS